MKNKWSLFLAVYKNKCAHKNKLQSSLCYKIENIKAILWMSVILSKGSECSFKILREKGDVRFVKPKWKVFCKRLDIQIVIESVKT